MSSGRSLVVQWDPDERAGQEAARGRVGSGRGGGTARYRHRHGDAAGQRWAQRRCGTGARPGAAPGAVAARGRGRRQRGAVTAPGGVRPEAAPV
jgi:hypothetical protein